MPAVDISVNKDRLVALFLKQSNLPVSFYDFDNHFYFNDPEPSTMVGKNTKIKVTGKSNSLYIGTRVLHYNRIPLSELGTIRVTREQEQTVVDLIPKINIKYGLFLSEYDLEENPLLAYEVDEFNVSVRIKPTSLIFLDDGQDLIYLIIDGGKANSVYPEPWQIAGGGGAILP